MTQAKATERRLELAKDLWALHLQAHAANAPAMALNAYRAHFDAVERVARAQRPDLWKGVRT